MMLGWKRDQPDHRDKKYSLHVPMENKIPLPSKVDLRSGMPPVYDQLQTSSCTAQSIAALLHFDRMKCGFSSYIPSRLFIYYNERYLEDNISLDNGASIRNGIKTVSSDGYISEKIWPFNPDKVFTKPSRQIYNMAVETKAYDSFSIDNSNLLEMQSCLASGYPFTFGFTIFQSFFDSADGKVNLPMSNENPIGGHAVVCCGYDDSTKMFTIRNSWGDSVGDKGYYYMPYSYVMNKDLSDDFWCIRQTKK